MKKSPLYRASFRGNVIDIANILQYYQKQPNCPTNISGIIRKALSDLSAAFIQTGKITPCQDIQKATYDLKQYAGNVTSQLNLSDDIVSTIQTLTGADEMLQELQEAETNEDS